MATINVCMLGPKGCGKTSILAVMLHDVQKSITTLISRHGSRFDDDEVRPALDTSGWTRIRQKVGVEENALAKVRLEDAYPLLRRLVEAARHCEKNMSVDMAVTSILGDVDINSHPLTLSIGKHSTGLVFWDFPGGFYSQKQIDSGIFEPEDVKTWEDIIVNADVLLIALDAAAQLGKFDILKDSSYYTRITELVKKSVAHSSTSVVFVPVKCEHMALHSVYNEQTETIRQSFDRAGCENLKKLVQDKFPELMKCAADMENWGNMDAYFMPMITVGGVRCDDRGCEFDPIKRRAKLRFVPVDSEHPEAAPFVPRNCDKILALCLLRVYQQLVQEWKTNSNLFERLTARIRALFGDKTPFEAFFKELSDKYHFGPMFLRKYLEVFKEKGDAETVATCEAGLASWGNVPYDGCECLNFCIWPLHN